MSVYVIYHDHCPDGLASASIMKHYLEETYKDSSVIYVGGSYSKAPPEIKDSLIIFLDFSYKLPVMEELVLHDNKIILIDHHKSAIEGLASLIKDELIEAHVSYDNTLSGVGLTWKYCYPDKPMPTPLLFIQDRDLWTWNYQESKPYLSALSTVPRDLENYSEAVEAWLSFTPEEMSEHIQTFIRIGKAILKTQDNTMESTISSMLRFVDILGYRKIPTMNVPGHMSSEGCHRLLELYPESPFAFTWSRSANELKISLRSKGNVVDVSLIANQIHPSGGGHFNASGVNILNKDIPDNEVAQIILS